MIEREGTVSGGDILPAEDAQKNAPSSGETDEAKEATQQQDNRSAPDSAAAITAIDATGAASTSTMAATAPKQFTAAGSSTGPVVGNHFGGGRRACAEVRTLAPSFDALNNAPSNVFSPFLKQQ